MPKSTQPDYKEVKKLLAATRKYRRTIQAIADEMENRYKEFSEKKCFDFKYFLLFSYDMPHIKTQLQFIEDDCLKLTKGKNK